MCGKFTQMASWRQVHDYSGFFSKRPEDSLETVTPMRFASVICLGPDGQREVREMRWGIADRRAKTPGERPKHIHARAETIDQLPAFAEAFANQRGLIVVNTFNEGEEITPTKTRQHTVTPRDAGPLAIAVIWERWIHRDEGELLTFAMVTTAANKLISKITDRMPAIICPEGWAIWLGETSAPLLEVKALLRPREGDWEMAPQQKTAPPGRAPGKPVQPDLF
jgi:putative SOS response-associated peptidase YedK